MRASSGSVISGPLMGKVVHSIRNRPLAIGIQKGHDIFSVCTYRKPKTLSKLSIPPVSKLGSSNVRNALWERATASTSGSQQKYAGLTNRS